ncbi:carboxymuconolactone decarboxylase family protein [Nevskia sp.]|uniref:carboxymuconolactone decarboxylase family protein n=1 Tax=Nevskia sp. TaxID=1929292 RepID=UPI0025EC9DFC|nr:carboxymuconolactone decarboxylase family protein [Nevskia sp.]
MLHFPLPTAESAPEASRATLAAVEKAWGFAPNLMRTFANSPAVVQGAWGLLNAFEQSSFSPAERQLVMIAASVENACGYCAAGHSLMGRGAGLSETQVAALRAGEPLNNARLEALRSFTVTVVAKRGYASDEDLQRFLAHGYTPTQVLEVVLGVAAKTLTNYVDHIASVPLDDAFKTAAWSPADRKAA